MNQRYEKSREFVGIDLHRRRSVIVRIDGEGEVVDLVRIENSVPALVAEVSKAGPGAPVAVEATYGWYWAVDALTGAGFEVVLAHPRGAKSPGTDSFLLHAAHASPGRPLRSRLRPSRSTLADIRIDS